MINGVQEKDLKNVYASKYSGVKSPKTRPTESKEDKFVKKESKGASDGKFTKKEAFKNFGKGMISPIMALIKHPIATIGVLAGTVAACTLIPVLAPVMAIGFGALSIFQLGKGGLNAVKEYKKGNFDNSEKAFQEIGTGFVGTALSLLGLKGTAKIAAEAKVLQKAGTTTIESAKKAEIAAEIAAKSKMGVFKENMSLFTTKDGLKAVLYQLKPKMIKARFNEITGIFKKISKSIKNRGTRIDEFKKSPEGIRRASLTDEQIKAEAETLFNQAFDEIGVPKELRPELKIIKAAENEGGSYNRSEHAITFKSESYKAGIFEIDDVIMHEATHCKETLLRASLSPEKNESTVRAALIDRIKNGESEQIIKKGGFMGPDMIEPPKLSPKMKNSFAEFAEQFLYNQDNKLTSDLSRYTINKKLTNHNEPRLAEIFKTNAAETESSLKPILDKLNKMISENPDFTAQYKNADDALNALVDYSCSHNVRYRIFTDTTPKGIKLSDLPKLAPEQEAAAIQSTKDYIATTEGNGRVAGINGIFASDKNFNQYQFSPEEVLAQQEGNKFLIKNMTAKLNEMKQNGTLTPEKEAYINSVLTKANHVIEYKTKGLEYYKLYEKVMHNPADKQLAESLKLVEAELNKIKRLMDKGDIAEIDALLTIMLPPNYALPAGIMGND